MSSLRERCKTKACRLSCNRRCIEQVIRMSTRFVGTTLARHQVIYCTSILPTAHKELSGYSRSDRCLSLDQVRRFSTRANCVPGWTGPVTIDSVGSNLSYRHRQIGPGGKSDKLYTERRSAVRHRDRCGLNCLSARKRVWCQRKARTANRRACSRDPRGDCFSRLQNVVRRHSAAAAQRGTRDRALSQATCWPDAWPRLC